jgi:N utilization substance protein B
MISRRLVRIKTLQTLYSWKQSNIDDENQFIENLKESIHQSHTFYLFLLDFPYQLQQYLNEKLVLERTLFYPDAKKIQLYSILNNTPLIQKIHQEVLLTGETIKFSWDEIVIHFETWFQNMLTWDFVNDYSIFEAPDFQLQKEFLDNLFFSFFDSHEHFNEVLEDINHSWPDDASMTLREINKTIMVSKQTSDLAISKSILLNDEDLIFGLNMLKYTIRNSEKFEEMVSEVTENWDPSRIAVVDLLIIKLTLSEFLYFPEIPVKVTINEYLEITKNYSTPNSSKFVNGILDKLRIQLEKTGQIQKTGRGLREK